MYLRKSRADAEAEERGDGETLARHEKTLLELAKKLRLNIIEIYRELVSGETIAARPVMQQLLTEVGHGLWDGVLVMEVERLARGDTIDQGIMAQTFKFSNTKIITPMKTYDPNNEFDEEYFEFGLFMSRREYKTINRRLQRGRVASVKEGKYVSNKPPYGYERVKIAKEIGNGYTLEPISEQADIIRTIFDLYTTGELHEDGSHQRIGISLIVRRLNTMKVPTKMGGDWTIATVRDILINPVYIGKIRWNWRPSKKKMVDGQIKVERPRASIEDCVVVDGLHSGIVDKEIFSMAQEYMTKNPPRPIGEKNTVKNPLCGIVICGKCGRSMVRRPYNGKNKVIPATLMCAATSCDNVSVALHYVEERILEALAEWLGEYKLKWNICDEAKKVSQITMKRRALKKIDNDIITLNKQLDEVHNFLEQGIYTTDQFLERSKLLSERITKAKEDKIAVSADLSVEIAREDNRKNIIPKVEKLLEVYSELPNPRSKNDVLKEVLEKVIYTKTINGSRRGAAPDDFEIVLYPKLPIYGQK